MADAGLDPKDIAAAVGARRDLGPDYDDVIAASLADKIEQEITNRVNAQLGHVPGGRPYYGPPLPYQGPYQPPQPVKPPRDGSIALPIVSLVAGIPVTGIVAGTSHGSVLAIAVAWLGIAAVNVAHGLGRRRR